MIKDSLINLVPWDTKVLALNACELTEHSSAAVKAALSNPGHYTIRVDPLSDKKLLYENGFYYCDTLIEPYCDASRLRVLNNPKAQISKILSANQVMKLCHGAFVHGRFHRDFEISKRLADLRYDKWLEQLLNEENVYGLFWDGELAGFIGHKENMLVLHAVSQKYRGQGLAKYWWSAVCNEIFLSGYPIIKSSISAANLSAVNLYASLGFQFGNAIDVYHCNIK